MSINKSLSDLMSEKSEFTPPIRMAFREAFKSILGDSGVRVLEFHVRRISSSDLYELLYNDPRRFYETLTRFFGQGAKAFVRILANALIDKYQLNDVSLEEFAAIMRGEREDARDKLREIMSRISLHKGESGCS